MDIYKTIHLGHEGRVYGSGEDDLGMFLPQIFFGKTKNLLPTVGILSIMRVKKSGLVLLNPVTTAKENYLGS